VIFGFIDKYPSLTLYYVFKNLAINHKIILNYVAIQKEKGLIELYIESKLKDKEKNKFMLEFIKYFRNDLSLKLFDGVVYKQEKTKKTDFISFIYR